MANGIPRRRSVFGGLFWLLIGSLLLVNNFYPDFGFWSLFRQWWPALLILWGLVRLAENTWLRESGERPARTFSGGETFLLVILLILGGAITVASLVRDEDPDINIQLPWDRSYSATEELKSGKPLLPGGLVSVTNHRGDISVTPGPEPDVRVVVRKSTRIGTQEQADKRFAQHSVEILENEKGVEIRPKLTSDGHGYRGVTLDLEIHVPQKCAVDVKTDRGDIRVTGVAGAVSADSQRGEIEIRDAGGNVKVEQKRGRINVSGVKGDVVVKGRGGEVEIAGISGAATVDGEFYGPIRVKDAAKGARFVSSRTDLTIGPLPGSMELSTGDLEIRDTTGNVLMTSTEKDIRLENIGGRVKISNRTGNIEVSLKQPPKEELDIANESGNIELTLPAAAGFDLQASTRSGEIENEFSDPALKAKEEGGGQSLEGKHGTRGPQVKLHTRYGSVHLKKSG